jgi:hypothetical protein
MIATFMIGNRLAGIPSESGVMQAVCGSLPLRRVGEVADSLRLTRRLAAGWSRGVSRTASAHPQTRARRVRGDHPAMETTWTLAEQDVTALSTDCDAAVEDVLAAA